MKKSNKIYIVGWCCDDGIIHGVRHKAYKTWDKAVEHAEQYQKMLNEHIEKNRHTVIIGVRPDYVENKIEGCILGKISGHHYMDTEWL